MDYSSAYEDFEDALETKDLEVTEYADNWGYSPGEINIKSSIDYNPHYFECNLEQFPALCSTAILSAVETNLPQESSKFVLSKLIKLCEDLNYTKLFIALTYDSFRFWRTSKEILTSLKFKQLLRPHRNKRTGCTIYMYYRNL